MSNEFREFDYGNEHDNILHYGKKNDSKPPLIDILKIKETAVPVAMFVGEEDNLATPLDAKWLKDQLGDNVIEYMEIANFDHSSFNFGKDMSYVNKVIKLVA